MERTDIPFRARPSKYGGRFALPVLLAMLAASAGAYFAFDQYKVWRMAQTVRHAFAAHRYEEAREPLRRWFGRRPRSAEVQYYRAWLALVDDDPAAAGDAINRATGLRFDPDLLRPLTGIFQARSGQVKEAEPRLQEAFEQNVEPRAEVAKELARIYLTSYRLSQAALVIERWRALAPDDSRPYLWSNEIASRTDAEASILIQNYRAALERDPTLDKARLGLAEQLGRDRRFDEAEQEFRAYLKRHPNDASVLVGLGRNAFQSGDLDGATRHFEAALKVDPRQPDALKELAQAELRLGRVAQACEHFERLTQIQPYDHEVRYAHAQALNVKGDAARARSETEMAARLRKEQDRILQLRYTILQNPNDVESRFEVARWMLDHGHVEEGLKWTREILRSNPRHAPTHRKLAEYYEQHGDPGLANYHRLMANVQ
jgi:tetratricopeptide (TPR) repeat protein